MNLLVAYIIVPLVSPSAGPPNKVAPCETESLKDLPLRWLPPPPVYRHRLLANGPGIGKRRKKKRMMQMKQIRRGDMVIEASTTIALTPENNVLPCSVPALWQENTR